MIEIVVEDLYKHGLLFGKDKTSWNPKMRKHIKGIRILDRGKSIYLIDPDSTLKALQELEPKIREAIQQEYLFLFVGTKKVAAGKLKEFCEKYMDKEKYSEVSLKFNYVVHRWIGGTITNARNITTQVRKYRQSCLLASSPEMDNKSRKEQTKIFKLIRKKKRIYEGLINLKRQPNIVFVIDSVAESTAVKEARQKGVYVIGTTNTHADPEQVDFPIPMNDESRKPIIYLLNYLDKIIADEIIEIRAKNENLTKEEYLERMKTMEESEKEFRSGIEKADAAKEDSIHTTTENIQNVLSDEK